MTPRQLTIRLIVLAIAILGLNYSSVNFVWIAFDLLIFGVVIQAVRYPGYDAWLDSNKLDSNKKKEGSP